MEKEEEEGHERAVEELYIKVSVMLIFVYALLGVFKAHAWNEQLNMP